MFYITNFFTSCNSLLQLDEGDAPIEEVGKGFVSRAVYEALQREHEELKTAKESIMLELKAVRANLASKADELRIGETAAPLTWGGILHSSKASTFNQGQPTTTKRGLGVKLAKRLEETKADFKSGLKKHDEVIHNNAIVVHERQKVILESILGNTNDDTGKLQQAVVQLHSESNMIVHWKFQQDNKVSYELLLGLRVVREVHVGEEILKIYMDTVDEIEVFVNIEPFEETSEKVITLEVHKGEIVLAPEKYGQTYMTMRAALSYGEAIERTKGNSSTSSTRRSRSTKSRTGRSFGRKTKKERGSLSASDVFSRIGLAIFERFEQPSVIDGRMYNHFIKYIERAPLQTKEERTMVNNIREEIKEMDKQLAPASMKHSLYRNIEENILNSGSHGERIYTGLDDRVEKFLVWQPGNSVGWGKTKTVVDISAEKLFAELWGRIQRR